MRNAFLKDWGLYLLLLLATQPVPLSSQKVTLEAGVWNLDEEISHTGCRCSGASLHLSACPAHLTEAHALSAPRGGTFHPNPVATRRPGPAPLTALPYLLVCRLSKAFGQNHLHTTVQPRTFGLLSFPQCGSLWEQTFQNCTFHLPGQ